MRSSVIGIARIFIDLGEGSAQSAHWPIPRAEAIVVLWPLR